MKIILIDLECILNNPVETTSIQNEAYDTRLIKFLRHYKVFVITARQEKHKKETLDSLRTKTGWLPRGIFFRNGTAKEEHKEKVLLQHILKFYSPNNMLAVDNNSECRSMYLGHGIKTASVNKFLTEI